MKSSNSCTVTRVQFSKFSVKKDNDSGLTSLLDGLVFVKMDGLKYINDAIFIFIVGTAVFHNSEDGKSRRRASGMIINCTDKFILLHTKTEPLSINICILFLLLYSTKVACTYFCLLHIFILAYIQTYKH